MDFTSFGPTQIFLFNAVVKVKHSKSFETKTWRLRNQKVSFPCTEVKRLELIVGRGSTKKRANRRFTTETCLNVNSFPFLEIYARKASLSAQFIWKSFFFFAVPLLQLSQSNVKFTVESAEKRAFIKLTDRNEAASRIHKWSSGIFANAKNATKYPIDRMLLINILFAGQTAAANFSGSCKENGERRPRKSRRREKRKNTYQLQRAHKQKKISPGAHSWGDS